MYLKETNRKTYAHTTEICEEILPSLPFKTGGLSDNSSLLANP